MFTLLAAAWDVDGLQKRRNTSNDREGMRERAKCSYVLIA